VSAIGAKANPRKSKTEKKEKKRKMIKIFDLVTHLFN